MQHVKLKTVAESTHNVGIACFRITRDLGFKMAVVVHVVHINGVTLCL